MGNTLERHPKSSRWTETLTIFKNLFTSNLPFPTPRPNSTESSRKQCSPSRTLLDRITELAHANSCCIRHPRHLREEDCPDNQGCSRGRCFSLKDVIFKQINVDIKIL